LESIDFQGLRIGMVRKQRKVKKRRRPKKGGSSEGRTKAVVLLAGLFFTIVILGTGGFGVYKALEKSDFFQVTSLKIEGCSRTSKKLILDLSGIDIHANLLAVNVNKVRARISSHEWVESVNVERKWPNRLVIEVTERVPVAILNLPKGLYYLDRHGVAFAKVIPPEDMDYPVITGLKSDWSSSATHTAALHEALRFITYASRGSSILPKQNISEIHLTDQGDAILYLVERPFPIYLGQGETYTAYSRLAKVLYNLYKRKEFSETAYIRMDYMEDKVLVGLTGKA